MIKALKEWWNKDKNLMDARFKVMQDQIDATKVAAASVAEELAQAEEKLAVYRIKEAEDTQRYNSVEPWIEIKSDGIDPIKGMVIECDWNPAFIQFLKENGITAKDEDTAVQKYIALLYEDIVNKMEQKVIDDSDKPGKVSDFA